MSLSLAPLVQQQTLPLGHFMPDMEKGFKEKSTIVSGRPPGFSFTW